MSEPNVPGGGSLRDLAALAEAVDRSIPAGYRREAFRALAAHVVAGAAAAGVPQPGPAAGAQGGTESGGTPESVGAVRPALNRGILMSTSESRTEMGSAAGVVGVGLEVFSRLMGSPGKLLLKALVVLQACEEQSGLEWLTPGEIEKVLREQGGVTGVYRSNLANALRQARGRVERRSRGRGYEYRITAAGRDHLAAELRRASL